MIQTNKESSSTRFYFDQERLPSIADKKIISNGIKDHRENKVMEIDLDHEVLWGQVEGEQPDFPENVTISFCQWRMMTAMVESRLRSIGLGYVSLVMIPREAVLKAATLLIDQDCPGPALELLTAALLAAASDRANRATAVTPARCRSLALFRSPCQ